MKRFGKSGIVVIVLMAFIGVWAFNREATPKLSAIDKESKAKVEMNKEVGVMDKMLEEGTKDDYEKVLNGVKYSIAYQNEAHKETGSVNLVVRMQSELPELNLKKELGNLKRTEDLTSYLSFNLSNNFSVIVSGDTLPCLMYQYVPMYNDNIIEFLVGFEIPKTHTKSKDLKFVWRDELFNNGTIVLNLPDNTSKNG